MENNKSCSIFSFTNFFYVFFTRKLEMEVLHLLYEINDFLVSIINGVVYNGDADASS